MTARSCLALLLLLAGCATDAPPENAACEQQSDADPAVHELLMKGAGSDHFRLEHQDDLREAKKQATLTCLRQRGLAPKGGIERQRNPR